MGDSYRPLPPRDRGGGHGDTNNSFTFRGAADNYRPPQQRPEEGFSFRNPPTGPAAPRFPAQQPPPRPQQFNRPGTNNKRDRGRGGRQYGGQPYRRIPKPAHAREILHHKDRETTPEQLEGMKTDSQLRYLDNASDSESSEDSEDSEDSDDTSDSDDKSQEDNDDGHSRKRVKMDDAAAPARPQWSNPDPYSVLPPTDLGLQPKKDIVQTIRKAKVDPSNQVDATNSIKENADFISFDFGEEPVKDDDKDEIEVVGPPSSAPNQLWKPSDREAAEELMQSTQSDAGGKKRKRVESQSDARGDIVDEWWADPNDSASIPWHKPDQSFTSSVGLQLHMEIIDFYDYVRPYPYEEDVRNNLIDRIEYAVRRFTGNSAELDVKVRSFGSFACGLYLPTADMDLVAVSRSYESRGYPLFCQSNTTKHKLGRYLEGSGIARRNTLTVIGKAKVPIIKFVDDRTGIKVDISFENDSGLRAIDTFRRWREQYPEMPLLVMIIKQFLAMRGLNEVFNGGLGGFTIICLVVSMLQLMPENQRKSEDNASQYGKLLRDFFDLYGNKFKLANTGITMNPPGYFNKKNPRACEARKINAKGLTIIDPNNPQNDISGGSRQVSVVFSHFREAFYTMQNQMNKIREGKADSTSILGCILAGNYSSFEEQRDILDRIDRMDREANRPPPVAHPPSTSAFYPSPHAAPTTQHGWTAFSQQTPPPAREGHYYAPPSAHGYEQQGLAYPPPQDQQTGFAALPARPPPSTHSAPGSQPGNASQKQSKKANNKGAKAQKNPSNTNEGPTKKSKSQKKKEKREKQKLENNKQGSAASQAPQAKMKANKVEKKKKKASRKPTKEDKDATAKEERNKRAQKRLVTFYGDIP